MTIVDPNGNTLKTGKPAANWAAKHAKALIALRYDSAGRGVADFADGNVGFFFPQDEHKKLVAKLHAANP